ncbi:MAG: hypothetical protein MUF87_06210 [Anaerolineae bacterium]|jgi:hypothetical protein|nr:hypothetical protein [Anaerolineae bacterium]
MSDNYQLLLTVFFSLMFFTVQRTETQYRRRVLVLFALFPGVLIFVYMSYLTLLSAFWNALLIAFILNLFFWIVIGRYNPVRSSEEIQVLGMDD